MIIDLGPNKCGLEEGLRYVNNNRVRKLVESLYPHKTRKGVIFITATALCHLVKRYGMHFLALPFAIGDFGLTNYYQAIRKGVVTLLVGVPIPIVYFYFSNPLIMAIAVMFWVGGLKLGSINLDYIPTSLIDPNTVIEMVQPRIPDIVDVVSVNLKPRDMVMEEPRKPECLLADQVLTNPNCRIKPTQIPDATLQSGINYDDVVNMQDLTGLTLANAKFSDITEVGKTVASISSPKASIPSPKPSPRPGKMVNFLDKFRDPSNLDESTSWDLDANNFEKKPVIDMIVEDFE